MRFAHSGLNRSVALTRASAIPGSVAVWPASAIISNEASAQANIVVRAIGPSLGTIGVAGALQDPTLELRDSNGTLLAFDDDWGDSQGGIIRSEEHTSELQSQ